MTGESYCNCENQSEAPYCSSLHALHRVRDCRCGEEDECKGGWGEPAVSCSCPSSPLFTSPRLEDYQPVPAVVFPGSGMMLLRRQRSPLGPAFRSGLGPTETEPVLRALLIPAGAGRVPGSGHRVGLDWWGEPGHGRATP